jgi:hypothetical protein
MKKAILLLFTAAFCLFSANAQDEVDFKPFKVELASGYAIPSGNGAKGGLIMSFEAKYGVTNNVSVGLKLESATMIRGYESSSSSSATEFELKSSGCYLLTGDYYFSNKYSFRPFAGVGVGMFALVGGSHLNSFTTPTDQIFKFGEMIRAGFESGHFRLGVEYSLVPQNDLMYSDGSSNTIKVTSKNNYIGIKLGVVIGGGPEIL